MKNQIQQGWLKSMYRPKDCDYSVTDICMPRAQLWAKAHSPEEDRDETVGFKSFLGSALHKVIEEQDEDGVVKEVSWVKTMEDGTRIGGTADELRWLPDSNIWRLGDVKLKGAYPTRKFLGIGTKAIPNPPKEQEKEQLQMSIYRWLFDGMFNIADDGIIYLFTPGHASYEKFPEYQEITLKLDSINYIDKYIKDKLAVAKVDKQPDQDCPKWLCQFCPFQKACGHYKAPEEERMDGFVSEI